MAVLIRNRVGEPRCPSCREWSPNDAIFCTTCGLKLEDNTQAVTSPAEQRQDKPEIALTESNAAEDSEPDPEQVQENTKQFFESLRWPTMAWLMQNDITQRSILIVGSPEAGKSSKVDELIYDPDPQRGIIARYERKNVEIQKVQGEDLGQILEAEKWPRKRIQVIVSEDNTDKTFKKKSVAGFFEFRHKMEEKTGLKHGLVITIMTVHSFFKIPDEFRTIHIAALLFCDIPTSPDGTFQHSIYEKFIPNKADRAFLQENAELRLLDRERCGYAAWTRWGQPAGSKERTGIIYLPAPPETKKRFGLHFIWKWPARGEEGGPGEKLFTPPVIGFTVLLLGIIGWQIVKANWIGVVVWSTVLGAAFGLRLLLDRIRK